MSVLALIIIEGSMSVDTKDRRSTLDMLSTDRLTHIHTSTHCSLSPGVVQRLALCSKISLEDVELQSVCLKTKLFLPAEKVFP